MDRLNPFVISLGYECALVVGGVQAKQMSKVQKLVKEAEIIDTRQAISYMPASKYRLPDNTQTVLGLFKLS